MQGRAVIRELSLQNSPDFIACPLAIRTKAYRSTIVLVASCKLPANHGAIEYILQPLPRLLSPSTRTAPSAWCPRRDGGPQSFVPCPTHPNSIADTPAHAAHGWADA